MGTRRPGSGLHEPGGVTNEHSFSIGLLFAISSSVFIGSSFILKKIGLHRLRVKGGVTAGSGGYGYLYDWVWWLGILTMGIGEVANFVAYGFAPATLVTPLGALSVVVSALLSTRLLNERMNIVGKCGCLLCVCGAIVLIFHCPSEQSVQSSDTLAILIMNPGFTTYSIFAMGTSLFLIAYPSPQYARTNVMVYIGICSLLGSFSVMACKGVALTIQEIYADKMTSYTKLIAVLSVVTLILCIVFQMCYLNKALDIFNTALVTTVYYVCFTTCVIVASTLLFQEWKTLETVDVAAIIVGFIIVSSAMFLMTSFKDVELTWNRLTSSFVASNIQEPTSPLTSLI